MLFTPSIGAEVEFYLFGNSGGVNKVLESISSRGIKIDKEKGTQQFEFIIDHSCDIQNLVEKIRELKKYIYESARQNSVEATFAAKPLAQDYGSGMHMHISLHNEEGMNIFSDNTIDTNLYLLHSIGGLLSVTKAALPMVCQNAEDYLRYVPHFMAPTKISWGGNNRTTVIRIPDSKPCNRRIEYRLAPANCDPQTLVDIILQGVSYGIENSLMPPKRIWGNANDCFYELDNLVIT